MAAVTYTQDRLREQIGERRFTAQPTADGVPTVWIGRNDLVSTLRRLKHELKPPCRMLYDLTAIDERLRERRAGQPASDFTLVYHLLSLESVGEIRIKVALAADDLVAPSITDLWPAANWYEREVFDMFGVRFDGHPHLTRILMPPTWEGHPLRKDHPARGTEILPYELTDEDEDREQAALQFNPEQWGLQRRHAATDFMFLNLGPNHPSAHGVFRIVLQLDGEEIVDAIPDIGYHHRGAEKMGERQSWHSYIPYTDRIDYLGGVMNNLPYVMAVEQIAGIEVPERVKTVRVMLCELFRIMSHLLFFGTFVQDLGALSPIFYMFSDRQKIYDIVEAICGFRMHPSWFRIGGLAADLPDGWERLVRDLLHWLPPRLDEYERMIVKNRTLKARSRGIGAYDTAEAIEWGVTGPNLRATGLEWDLRKRRPYSGYDWFEFDIPTGVHGDCYDRCRVRVEEMRQSLAIVRQCWKHMPAGEHKARHPLTTPPIKDRTMHDIETLINHFLGVSWGPVLPAAEAHQMVEATKGLNGYYLISDGGGMAYRTRIRTPSFPHLQQIPEISRGLMLADLIAIVGAIDFVMADVDR